VFLDLMRAVTGNAELVGLVAAGQSVLVSNPNLAISLPGGISLIALLHVGDLPSNLQQYSNEEALDSNELTTLDEVERRFIFRALREANGDKLAAARLLGMGKTTLYRKLKQYGAKSAPN